MELKCGNVVQLKSGGPVMTVVEVAKFRSYSDGEQAKCIWFDKTGIKKFEDVFELVALEIVG